MAAMSVVDDLMNQFVDGPDGIPIAQRGSVPGRPTWIWQTQVVGRTAPAGIPLHVIRLEVMDVSVSNANRSLASIDVVKAVDGVTQE